MIVANWVNHGAEQLFGELRESGSPNGVYGHDQRLSQEVAIK